MPRSYANRCQTVETRGGRRVRCALSRQHTGHHISRGRRFDLIVPDLETVEEAQHAVICGKVWVVQGDLGHVCYQPTGHTGAHVCWCDAEARARAAS